LNIFRNIRNIQDQNIPEKIIPYKKNSHQTHKGNISIIFCPRKKKIIPNKNIFHKEIKSKEKSIIFLTTTYKIIERRICENKVTYAAPINPYFGIKIIFPIIFTRVIIPLI